MSDAHLIGQLANWIIDQIFEIELGHGNCLDWHETWRNEVFRPKFAKMGSGEPIFGRKYGTKTEVSENGHFRVGNLEGRSAGQILIMEMVPQVTGNKSSIRNFSLRRSPNWPIS